jgi:hypothetical protein
MIVAIAVLLLAPPAIAGALAHILARTRRWIVGNGLR